MREPTDAELIVSRARGRRRTEKPGSIFRSSAAEPLSCIVLDLSRTGARISYGGPEELPSSFRLHVGAGGLIPCVVAWRHRNVYGLKFGPLPA